MRTSDLSRYLVPGVRVLLLLTLLLLGSAPPLLALTAGSPAPSFTLTTPQGGQVSLADFKGRIVLLKIGTTWCSGCQVLTGELRQLDGFLAQERAVVIEVFVGESAAEVKGAFGGRVPPPPVVALLGDDRFNRAYGVYLIPRLIFLDREQRVVFDGGGERADEIKARYLQIKAGDGSRR